jgi:hypothetical protein
VAILVNGDAGRLNSGCVVSIVNTIAGVDGSDGGLRIRKKEIEMFTLRREKRKMES